MGSKADAHVMQNGVYVLKDNFARGFDLKFAINAYVYIYAGECVYSASTIRQMVGRANRAQGAAHGRVFLHVKNFLLRETNMHYIEDIDK